MNICAIISYHPLVNKRNQKRNVRTTVETEAATTIKSAEQREMVCIHFLIKAKTEQIKTNKKNIINN